MESNPVDEVGELVLPDDVVLHIFSLLDRKTLVSEARALCRQWRKLAAHLSLWRDVHYCLRFGRALKDTVLEMRVAPRVRFLNVDLRGPVPGVIRRNLLPFEWQGKVDRLTVAVAECETCSLWVDLFRKFKAHLTSLIVTYCFKGCTLSKQQVLDFLKCLGQAPCLKHLLVSTSPFPGLDKPVRLPPLALEEMYVDGRLETSEAVLVSMIRGSRGSLKKVHLLDVGDTSRVSGTIFRELARCPVLKKLYSPKCPDMVPLAASASLTKLRLSERWGQGVNVPDVDGLLRALALARGPRPLRKLGVSGSRGRVLPAVKLLTQLTSLTLDGSFGSDVADLLRSLPDLEELVVTSFPASASDVTAISADLAPRLRLLFVRLEYNRGRTDDVLDALCAQRPALRIIGHPRIGLA